jgi:hypothetical protein
MRWEKTAVYDIEIMHFVGRTVESQHRSCRVFSNLEQCVLAYISQIKGYSQFTSMVVFVTQLAESDNIFKHFRPVFTVEKHMMPLSFSRNFSANKAHEAVTLFCKFLCPSMGVGS